VSVSIPLLGGECQEKASRLRLSTAEPAKPRAARLAGAADVGVGQRGTDMSCRVGGRSRPSLVLVMTRLKRKRSCSACISAA
jgi:hypothetical protein